MIFFYMAEVILSVFKHVYDNGWVCMGKVYEKWDPNDKIGLSPNTVIGILRFLKRQLELQKVKV